jgi:subtilisin family serine protease
VILAVTLVITAATGLRAQPPLDADAFVAGEVLVQFRPGTDETRRAAIRSAHGLSRVREYRSLRMERLRIPRTASPMALTQALRAHGEVEAAQPNFIRQTTSVASPNDPYLVNGSLWGLQKISAPAAWAAYGAGTETVVVADIDSGVNYSHPDLAVNMWRNPGEVPGNGIDDDANGYVDDVNGIDTVNNDSNPADDQGHGTHTSGSVGAVSDNGIGVAGVANNVRILACKFLSSQGEGSDADAIECFNYVIALKQRGVNVRVTTNSWGSARGGFFPSALKNAIDALGNAGIVNVFSAGNAGVNVDVTPFDPASFTSPSIISVAASDGGDARASFSNYGVVGVDLAAPGVNILSTYASSYAWGSGTSMAAPHVAGAAAALLAHRPWLSVSEVKEALLGSVDRLGGWTGLVASGGRLNMFQALNSVPLNNASPSVVLTSPVHGASFAVPATVTLAANAFDADGSISAVTFYANGTFVGSAATSPYTSVWTVGSAGTYTLTAVATDNLGATTTSPGVTVTAVAAPVGGLVNVAAAAAGASASASSSFPYFGPGGAIDGDRNGTKWEAEGGWHDTTADAYPDWFEVNFGTMRTISEVDVFSIQDAYASPSVPTPSMTFSRYGLRAFEVQYWTGSGWQTIPGAVVSGNNLVWRQFTFTPIATSRIRLWITDAAGTYSRLVEVEAWGTASASAPPSLVNVAAAAAGATASASSSFPSFGPGGVIDGDRNGTKWQAEGGWHDTTADTYPDWLEVNFQTTRTISQVDVFSVQDAYSAPSAPTASMTFSRYGVRGFEVQYWTGAGWQTIPGAVVSGNNLVWRHFTFAPISTSRIRVWITDAAGSYSRLVEVEAWGSQ